MILFLVLMSVSVVAIFFRHMILNVVYGALGAFVFSCYIVFDTQVYFKT